MSRKKRMLLRLGGIILLFLWIGVITSFSAETAVESSARSGRIVGRIAAWISSLGWSSESEIVIAAQLSFWVRKAGHFSEFCLLGVIAESNMNLYALSVRIRFLISASLCLLVAIGDELHQYFVPGRSCELRDVAIDFCGACFGILLVALLMFFISRRVRKKQN